MRSKTYAVCPSISVVLLLVHLHAFPKACTLLCYTRHARHAHLGCSKAENAVLHAYSRMFGGFRTQAYRCMRVWLRPVGWTRASDFCMYTRLSARACVLGMPWIRVAHAHPEITPARYAARRNCRRGVRRSLKQMKRTPDSSRNQFVWMLWK